MKMKRNSKFIMLGVIALTGVTAFTSCSSDESAPVNPTFDGKSVKTAFALNIPHAAQTRMSADITQNNSNFRDMQDIFLFPMNAVPADATPFPYVNINLPNTGYDASHSTSTSRSSQIYRDVNIGVGTNNFLFYAEATHGDITTKAGKFANGVLTKTLATTLTKPSEIKFDLNTVYDATGEGTAYTNAQTALLGILNGVSSVTFTKPSDSSPKAWSALTTADDGLKYQSLVDLYVEYTKTARNGSGPNVLNTMQALYNNVHWIDQKSTDNDVKALCTAIMTKIAESFTATHNETTHTNGSSSTSPDYKPECYTLEYKITNEDAKDFPKTTFGLPYGAAELTCTSGTFAYNDTPVGTGFDGGANLKPADICFPASLQYFCNTPAKANNESIEDTSWPTTTTAWDGFDWNTNWGNVVTSTTRTIALRNNVNYGVAELKATVKCVDATTLKDNSSARDGDGGTAEDIDVTIPTEGFTVTGFLIGGQPQTVDWQFLPTGSTRSRIIYDNTMNEAMAAKQNASVGTNYTLVLDNWITGTTQDKVNIAVELKNNSGTDFWGYNGLIRADQTFYLIGQLDPAGKAITQKPYMADPYRYPQKDVVRVFMQDYTTTANFTINDLKKAYSTIPDLRVAKLELGLSVDLSWTAGVTYEVPLGN